MNRQEAMNGQEAMNQLLHCAHASQPCAFTPTEHPAVLDPVHVALLVSVPCILSLPQLTNHGHWDAQHGAFGGLLLEDDGAAGQGGQHCQVQILACTRITPAPHRAAGRMQKWQLHLQPHWPAHLSAATKMGDRKESTEASASGSSATARYREETEAKPSTPRSTSSQRRLRQGGLSGRANEGGQRRAGMGRICPQVCRK